MSKTVTACLIVIGNEILSGRTQDRNIAYTATRLGEAGIQLREVRVIPDIGEVIVDSVNEVRIKYDYVFTTGGIGPTHDDITAQNIALAFGVKMHRHPEAERILRSHYTGGQINEARLKMADMPEGASLLPNPVSSAPGFVIGNVYVMAGVPKIMQSMLDWVIPQLTGGAPMQSVSITTNLPEGTIADGLAVIDKKYPNVDIGSYPTYKSGEMSTTLVMRSTDAQANEQAAEEVRALIQKLGGQLIDTPLL